VKVELAVPPLPAHLVTAPSLVLPDQYGPIFDLGNETPAEGTPESEGCNETPCEADGYPEGS